MQKRTPPAVWPWRNFFIARVWFTWIYIALQSEAADRLNRPSLGLSSRLQSIFRSLPVNKRNQHDASSLASVRIADRFADRCIVAASRLFLLYRMYKDGYFYLRPDEIYISNRKTKESINDDGNFTRSISWTNNVNLVTSSRLIHLI